MIVILTGAGISQESGLATFRGSDGLWQNERIEDVATPRGFSKNPDKVHNFYNKLRRTLTSGEIKPNAAHLALARLERESREPVVLVTQNIDNLHDLAGSKSLLHMHGEALKARCAACNKVFVWEDDLSRHDVCQACGRAGHMRPHIVWFEEMPLYLDEIDTALDDCDLFVSIGTSGNVYPAAGFARTARRRGAQVMELNMEPSVGAGYFHEGRYGPATEVVPAWVEEVLAGQ